MKTFIIFFILVLSTISCDPDYNWHGYEYDYVSDNGWKNEHIRVETSIERINNATEQYFKWYRNDTLYIKGYGEELIESKAETHETYALVLFSNGYYTQFKKLILNDQVVLDTKWPRKTIDSLSQYEYERLEWS